MLLNDQEWDKARSVKFIPLSNGRLYLFYPDGEERVFDVWGYLKQRNMNNGVRAGLYEPERFRLVRSVLGLPSWFNDQFSLPLEILYIDSDTYRSEPPRIKSFSNANVKSLSSPRVSRDKVTNEELRRKVEDIGRPTDWWENNVPTNSHGYSFRIKGPDASSFSVGVGADGKVFMFDATLFFQGDIYRFSDTSQIDDLDVLLTAIAKPTVREIIVALRDDVGLDQDS